MVVQTNPICESSGRSRGPIVRNKANFAEVPACETKPISAGQGIPSSQYSNPTRIVPNKPNLEKAGRDQGPIVRNKANFAGGRIGTKLFVRKGLCRMYTSYRFCKTKPIWTEIGVQGSGVSNLAPGTRPLDFRAKQSQFALVRQDGQVSCSKGVMVNQTCAGPRQNKANLNRDQGSRVRDQQPDTQPRPPGLLCETKPICLRGPGRPSPRPEALTLPPVTAQSCETKPISPGQLYKQTDPIGGLASPGRDTPVFHYSSILPFPCPSPEPVVRNKANLPKVPRGGQIADFGLRLGYGAAAGPPGLQSTASSLSPLAGLSRQTRRPRQKSPNRIPTRVSGSISRIGSAGSDFCRRRQTKPISRPRRHFLPLQYSTVPSFHSAWTGEADCANNGGFDGLRSFPEAG